jgi:hypothetical protein
MVDTRVGAIVAGTCVGTEVEACVRCTVGNDVGDDVAFVDAGVGATVFGATVVGVAVLGASVNEAVQLLEFDVTTLSVLQQLPIPMISWLSVRRSTLTLRLKSFSHDAAAASAKVPAALAVSTQPSKSSQASPSSPLYMIVPVDLPS